VGWPWIVAVAGLAWTITLGLQSVAECAHLWRYFPDGGGKEAFIRDTMRMEAFFAVASEGQKLQYERFVVIEEACGNLLFAGLLSLVAWLWIGGRSVVSGSAALKLTHSPL
jgi:hypothetical protein